MFRIWVSGLGFGFGQGDLVLELQLIDNLAGPQPEEGGRDHWARH